MSRAEAQRPFTRRGEYVITFIKEVIHIKKVELSMEQESKYKAIKALVEKKGNKQRVALKLGISVRQVNRLIHVYQEKGKAGFIHGNTGRSPSLKVNEETRVKVVKLYKEKYEGANFRHFTELLDRNEGIHLSDVTVTKLLESEQIFSPKVTKKKKRRVLKQLEAQKAAAKTNKEAAKIQTNIVSLQQAHPRRPRSTYFGELLQMDASPHKYVAEQVWHLHIAVDDCSGTITGAYFDTEETLNGYYHVLYQTLQNYGIPYRFLTDNRSVFVYKKKNSASPDEDAHTQFAYACSQLGISIETTSVPQAKGRVERYNATLQSRLPVELKLAGITTIDAANEFLKSYLKELNMKFALPLDGIKSVFEKQPEPEKTNMILAVLTQRTMDAGNCIRFKNKFYRLLNKAGNPVLYTKGTQVLVIEAFDGNRYCTVGDDIRFMEEVPEHYDKSRDMDPDYELPTPKPRYIPPMNHPWRLSNYLAFRKARHPESETA